MWLVSGFQILLQISCPLFVGLLQLQFQLPSRLCKTKKTKTAETGWHDLLEDLCAEEPSAPDPPDGDVFWHGFLFVFWGCFEDALNLLDMFHLHLKIDMT